ncbi:hypothetical protein LRS73_08240 [Methylobacterium currus]|uniref:hypothetical protein n=1 Tax=Methylobacterium currus TaxID=2051553 RepID=UPI001E3BC439|nr:hypothetical protein [Methylobacterium currus]UHC17839.1 hypothetical protein LRS73_08240 [Methylobacterium currus]
MASERWDRPPWPMLALMAERMKGGLHVPVEGVQVDFPEALKRVVLYDVAQ